MCGPRLALQLFSHHIQPCLRPVELPCRPCRPCMPCRSRAERLQNPRPGGLKAALLHRSAAQSLLLLLRQRHHEMLQRQDVQEPCGGAGQGLREMPRRLESL